MFFNPFPELFTYAYFVPTLLRVLVAFYFFSIAWHLVRERSGLAQVSLPIVGKVPPWLMWVSATLTALVAAALATGLGVQWAALAGVTLVTKHLSFWSRLAPIHPYPRSTYILLGVICVALLFLGAGALAFDLPL